METELRKTIHAESIVEDPDVESWHLRVLSINLCWYVALY